MYPNLYAWHELGSTSDAKNIQTVPKRRKLLSGETYHKQLVDENGQPLHPMTNCNMTSSIHNHVSTMVIIVWYNAISTKQIEFTCLLISSILY